MPKPIRYLTKRRVYQMIDEEICTAKSKKKCDSEENHLIKENALSDVINSVSIVSHPKDNNSSGVLNDVSVVIPNPSDVCENNANFFAEDCNNHEINAGDIDHVFTMDNKIKGPNEPEYIQFHREDDSNNTNILPQDLRFWLSENSISQKAANDLISIFRNHGHQDELKKDVRTLMKTPRNITGKIINGDSDDTGRFNTVNGKLDSCLRLLGTLMVEIKDVKQRIVANNEANDCVAINGIELEIKNDLPLNSREEVSAFNVKLLESKDYHQEFVRLIKQVGGANGKEYTERVLSTIFSTSFAADNSWEGKLTKYKINDLKLIKTCEEMILKKFTSWDRAEFAKAGTNWFRLGKQRAGLQKGQIQKQKDEDLRIKGHTE